MYNNVIFCCWNIAKWNNFLMYLYFNAALGIYIRIECYYAYPLKYLAYLIRRVWRHKLKNMATFIKDKNSNFKYT